MRALLFSGWLAAALAVAGLACSDGDGQDSGPCTAGATGTCSCGVGRVGSRICGEDATWGACECAVPCASEAECNAAAPFCLGGLCVACRANGDCPSGICNEATHACDAEICGNGLDDDGNGARDCLEETCWDRDPCRTAGACGVAADCGAPGDQVCVSGSCELSGARAPDGGVARGELRFDVTNEGAGPARSMELRLFYPRRSTGSALDCTDLEALPYETHPELNLVKTVVGEFTGSFRVPGIPATGERPFVALLQGFSGDADDDGAHGYRTGETCVEGLQVPGGEFVDDAAHVRAVTLELACGGPRNRECPEPLTCVVGLCVDARCGPCAPGFSCRDLGGAPACHRLCDPANPDCPNLYRCDAAPGFPPVCAEAG